MRPEVRGTVGRSYLRLGGGTNPLDRRNGVDLVMRYIDLVLTSVTSTLEYNCKGCRTDWLRADPRHPARGVTLGSKTPVI